jgi:hypothetical protein
LIQWIKWRVEDEYLSVEIRQDKKTLGRDVEKYANVETNVMYLCINYM